MPTTIAFAAPEMGREDFQADARAVSTHADFVWIAGARALAPVASIVLAVFASLPVDVAALLFQAP